VATNNTVELKVKVTDETQGALSRIHGSLDELSRKFLGVGINAVATFGTLIKGLEKVYEESTQAELAAVRFGAAFDALGANIHVPREELEAFALAAQKSTRFSDENVKEAQATLLRFGDVTGHVFKEAQKLTLDLAEAMGGDASSAAQFLGRALENPIQAGRLLRQVGVYLNATQQEQVKNFIETGHQAKAQQIVLDELSARYSGLAEKIGNTTAGKVAELRHAFEDLFKVQDKFGPFNDALDTLNETISDPDFQKNVHEIFGAMVTTFSLLIRLGAGLINVLAGIANKIGEIVDKASKGVTSLSGADPDFKQSRPGTNAYQKPGYAAGDSGPGSRTTALTDFSGEETQTDKDNKRQRALDEQQRAFDRSIEQLQKQLELQESQDAMVKKTTEDIQNSADAVGDVNTQIAASVAVTSDAYDKLGEYSHAQLQAIDKIQGAFADMFSHIGEGIGGMLRAFLQALEQMVIQAAASHLTDYLFGAVQESTGKRSGGTEWGSALLAGFGALFGGGFAEGGEAPAGLKLVGESGPELISSGPARIWNSQQLATVMGGSDRGITYAPATTINVQGSMDKVTEARIYQYIEATRAKDQREVARTLQRNGMRNLR